MRSARTLLALGATLVVLSLLAHLWMFDAPAVHHPVAAGDLALASAPSQGIVTTGCPTGMGGCRVHEPPEPLLLLLLIALVVVHLRRAGDEEALGQLVTTVGPATERAPPDPSVPASVVLLE